MKVWGGGRKRKKRGKDEGEGEMREFFIERINKKTHSVPIHTPTPLTLPLHPIIYSCTHLPPHTLPHRVFPYLCRSVRNFVRDRGGVSVSKEFYVAFEDVPTRHKYVETTLSQQHTYIVCEIQIQHVTTM